MAKLLLVVGSINLDLVVDCERLPLPGETIAGRSFAEYNGGKGANQAVGIARLGHAVSMLGCVGDDANGLRLKAALTAAGVHADLVKPVAGSSGVALISHSASGENSIIVVAGANAQVTPDYLAKHEDLLAGAAMVLAQLEIPPATVEMVAELAERLHVPLMLDPAPAQALPASLLSRVTWLTPNETEAKTLLGLTDSDLPLEEIAERLLATGARNVVLKLGSKGVFLAGKDTVTGLIPAIKVTPVDTTAAGDCFNAAFAARLTAGDEPGEAARYANAAAGISVTRMGAQPSMPTAEEVANMLSNSSKS